MEQKLPDEIQDHLNKIIEWIETQKILTEEDVENLQTLEWFTAGERVCVETVRDICDKLLKASLANGHFGCRLCCG